MSSGFHIHVVDNKQLSYPNNNCPICGTAVTPTVSGKKIPNVHRKGNTVVLQVTKLQMGTVTWYDQAKAFLLSLRKVARAQGGNIIRQQDGRPVWNQITIRVSIPILKEFVGEIAKLIHDMETQPAYTQPQVPQRD